MNVKSHPEDAGPVVLGVEEEGAEDWDVNAVWQNGQVGLWELEGWSILLKELPHTLQEKQEDWRNILGGRAWLQ